MIFFFFFKKFEKVEKKVFFWANTQISNPNVLHKGLLLQDWVFRLGFDSFMAGIEFFSAQTAHKPVETSSA